MSVALTIPGREGRVELPNEPLALAREVLAELGLDGHAAAPRGRETDAGWSWDASAVAEVVRALDEVLRALDGAIDAEGQPTVRAPRRSYFNERQFLRAALALFRRAASEHAAVEASV